MSMNALFVLGLDFLCLVYFLCLSLVVSTSAVECLERLVPKITLCASRGTFNPTHSVTHCSY